MPLIRKILVANRGEIAVRVMRTCRELGIRTVAVFSDVDRTALHVQEADEAYRIGPAPSNESYLVQEKIIEVAKRSGADAIHPGYGFLSENSAFAEACDKAGIIFIGPPAAAIRAMGDKTTARSMMKDAGVPMAPGTTNAIESVEEAARIATDIGFPVLVKAAAGGGGKGMRIVADARDFTSSFLAAQREAASAFGDGRVYVEKYLSEPRHIEFQVLADAHGSVVHLFERECSIQRRHQKVVEEAPSAVLDETLRNRMGDAAVRATAACGYVGAGTVEFLLDADHNFYFMEMNTRLQVEHPVTEWITGIDLVAEQIRIAQGEVLGYSQDDVTRRGHAVECRIYAEDPDNNFLPDPGLLVRHVAPDGPNVRVDAGIEENMHVHIYYDPMISKLITWGPNRNAAIRSMQRALREYEIVGVRTTIPFCQFVMGHDAFTSGNFTTHFVQDYFTGSEMHKRQPDVHKLAAIAGVLYRARQEKGAAGVQTNSEQPSAWSSWRKQRK